MIYPDLPKFALSIRQPWAYCSPSPLGDPFVVSKHGDAAYCVDLYKALLAGLLRVGLDPDIEALERTRRFVSENVGELRSNNLACWCQSGPPCHADVLISVGNRDDEPRR